MPSPSRKLSLEDLAEARRLYEAGESYRDLGARFGVSHSTMRVLLAATGVTSRPVGRQLAPTPPPQPAVEIAPEATGRLRIPCRTREERRLDDWTAPELQAIEVELRAGRVQRVAKGRSGLPERASIADRHAAAIEFYRALQKVRAAA